MFSNTNNVRTFRWSVNLLSKKGDVGDVSKNVEKLIELPKKTVKSRKKSAEDKVKEAPENPKKTVGTKKKKADRELKNLKVADLKLELESRGQLTSGLKAVLVERLAGILEKEGHDPLTFVFNGPKVDEPKVESKDEEVNNAVHKVPKKKEKTSTKKASRELDQNQFRVLPLTIKYYFSLYPLKAQDLSGYADHDPTDTKYFEMLSMKVDKAQKEAEMEKVKAVVEEIKESEKNKAQPQVREESMPVKPQSSQVESPPSKISEPAPELKQAPNKTKQEEVTKVTNKETSEAVNVEAVPLERRSGFVRQMNEPKVDGAGSLTDALKNWWNKFRYFL